MAQRSLNAATTNGLNQMTIKGVAPYRDRAPKENPLARCCWVCGKLGGQGFSHALRAAGYRMEHNQMGYAHNQCMRRAALQAAKRETKLNRATAHNEE